MAKQEWRSRAHVLVLIILLGLTAYAAVPFASVFRELIEADRRLASGPEGGMQALTLSLNRARANELLKLWAAERDPSKPSLVLAQRDLALDDCFIWAYTSLMLCAGTFVCAWAYLRIGLQPSTNRRRAWPWLHWVGILVAVAVLAMADIAENRHLGQALENSERGLAEPFTHSSFIATRLLTQLKFTMLTLAALGIVLAFALCVRRAWRSLAALGIVLAFALCARRAWRSLVSDQRPDDGVTAGAHEQTFEQLITKEYVGIRSDAKAEEREIRREAAGEPWVSRCRQELVGLALSGGGIRSATFNLGLLQGLHRLDLIRHVDYMATVSGGGYIGGFWSKWLAQHANADQAPSELFPDTMKQSEKNVSVDSRVFEAAEVRHLREFGQFLVPRRGVFETETWGAVVAALAALVPALAAATCVLGLSLIGWLVFTFYLACPEPWARTCFAIGLTAAVLAGMEWWWRADPTGDEDATSVVTVVVTSLVAIALVGALAYFSVDGWSVWTYGRDGKGFKGHWLPTTTSSYESWWTTVGIVVPPKALVVSPRLYEPCIGWGLVALVLVLVRFRGAFLRSSMKLRVGLPAADRTAMRLLGLAVFWGVIATFWHLGLNLLNWSIATQAAAGAGASGGLFALLRNWIGQTMTRPRKASTWEFVKPYVPLVLAYVTVGLAWAVTASALIYWCQHDWMRWYAAGSMMSVVAMLVLLVDPAEFGMHGFYRDRICRAYLGAASRDARADAAQAEGPRTEPHEVVERNRQTDLRADDDIAIQSLLPRPLHLVCCAANNLSGDHLATLSRGARSAVLSRYGVAMGDHWARQPDLWLGSALTASAAAFNSNMGSVSMRVGPAVSFLMAALNLRLGLWVVSPRPEARPRDERLFPGWLFYREMFALTDTDDADLHLSDGAHFDNVGIYELVRRHCRYVIASDCTADPEVAFDDFGSAVRRIREDFGVEIDIDLDPLKPGSDGRARQHAVVGSINYGWFDKGILVYVKPSLVGNEPPDIRQYKMRNASFPHESTGDQFYDEAQWESYRRLGVHSIRKVFEYAEREDRERPEAVFSMAAQVWHPAPPNLAERMFQMSTRFAQLEEELKVTASVPMLREVFPELEHIGLAPDSHGAPIEGEGPTGRTTQEGELANLGYLLRVMTLMEDAVLAVSLDAHWDHPLNLGWVNSFARWATTPTFRRWWPMLRPMYGPDLRNFLESRFSILRDVVLGEDSCKVREMPQSGTAGLAYQWWHERDQAPQFSADQTLFEFCITLATSGSGPRLEIQTALVAIRKSGARASWTSDDFFVPLSLWGGGLGGRFLKELLKHLASQGIGECRVTVKGPVGVTADTAQWEERRRFVEFYRRAGFRIDEVGEVSAGQRAAFLSCALPLPSNDRSPAPPAEGSAPVKE